jgi:proline dehydrogenase
MLRSLLLHLSKSESARSLLSRNSFGRLLAQRFIAGEELDDAVRVVRRLNQQGLAATLDYLGEEVTEPAAAHDAGATYVNLLDRIAGEGLRSHISIKLTQLGLALDPDLAREQLRLLTRRAVYHQNFVRIDMEGSTYVDNTLRLFREVDAPRETLGLVIQSYLHRSERDVGELLRVGARIRLVKGAYNEPAEIAFRAKSDVDANFMKLMKMLLSSGGYHAIATHDTRMIAATQDFARARHLGPDRFEFQMLYGIRRQLQRDLAARGYRVRVYVPFGKQWYPYFMRRLAERPANVLFLARQIFRR